MTVPQAEALGLTLPDPDLRLERASAGTTTSARSTGHRVLRGDQGQRPVQRASASSTAAGRTRRARGSREAADGVRRKQAVATRPTAQAARRRRVDRGHRERRRDWPLWEVFVRSRRGLSHAARRLPARAGRGDGAAQRARHLHPAQEGVSLWVVPAAAIAASSPDEKDSFFDPAGRQGLPAPDVLRDPGGGGAPVVNATTTTMPALATYAPAARRRRAGPRAAAGRVDRQRAAARGGRRARQHRARPARPGAHAALLRRRGRGRRPDRGRPRLPARRARVPQRAAGRAAERRLRASRWRGS